MNSIQDIKHVLYINLESRQDRKIHVEEQLRNVGINNGERFNAIQLNNGALGCSMSHLKCLEIAKQNNWPHLLIVEDDILFTNPALFINKLNFFLSRHKNDFDVLLIAGNNVPPYISIDESCVKISKCQTTTGYLVQSHYYDTLMQNYREGIKNLMKYPDNHKFFAIDKYWLKLQEKDRWFLIVPLSVIQRQDYSNIEKKNTNYGYLMLDLDKKELIKNQIKAHLKQQVTPKLNLFRF
jgi:glycosyl transferase family 25